MGDLDNIYKLQKKFPYLVLSKYAASSFLAICVNDTVATKKPGLNGVAQFATLVNAYESVIVFLRILEKTAQCYDRRTKTERDFYYDPYCMWDQRTVCWKLCKVHMCWSPEQHMSH